ncbi:MAG: hypothetical protein AAFV90_13030 [Cyanobacteria bacterium J06634_5]
MKINSASNKSVSELSDLSALKAASKAASEKNLEASTTDPKQSDLEETIEQGSALIPAETTAVSPAADLAADPAVNSETAPEIDKRAATKQPAQTESIIPLQQPSSPELARLKRSRRRHRRAIFRPKRRGRPRHTIPGGSR